MDFELEAWKKYLGNGWTPIDMPSKQECFEAGYKACTRDVDNFILNSNDPDLIAWKEKRQESIDLMGMGKWH